MKYSDFPYKRIDFDQFKNNVEKMITQFELSTSAKNQIEIIEKYQNIQKETQTYGSIAHLNFARDTKDSEAVEENKFYDGIGPEIAAIDNKFTKAINTSKFKKDLLEKFGKHFFDLIDMELKSFDPKLVDLMKQENELSNEYRSLLAGAEMDYKGKTLNLAGLSPYMQDTNRETRKEAYQLMDNFFNNNEEKLDTIFDKLVKVRHKKAQVLSFDNFTPLGYLNMNRSDYGAQGSFRIQKTNCKAYCSSCKKNKPEEKRHIRITMKCLSMTLYTLRREIQSQKEV